MAKTYYEKCKEILTEECNTVLTPEIATFFVDKLCRHFKLGDPQRAGEVAYYNGTKLKRSRTGILVTFDLKDGIKMKGWCLPERKWLRLPSKPTLETIIHECAHLSQVGHKEHQRYHNKKHLAMMKRMIKYCEKMKYWGINNGNRAT